MSQTKVCKVKVFWGFGFCLGFVDWDSVNIPHLVVSSASRHSSHGLPFQLRGITAQPLCSFFQELELAAPIRREVGSKTDTRADGSLPGLLFVALLETRSNEKLRVTSIPKPSQLLPHLTHELRLPAQASSCMYEYNVVTVWKVFAESNRKSVLPLFT